MRSIADAISARLRGDPPWLIGIGGPVAVGKSTIAHEIAGATGGVVLSTDAFLYPNVVLEQRGIAMRKGFPESYDESRMIAALTALREGRSAVVATYSHERYDIVEGDEVEVAGDVIVVEGIVALQEPIRRFLDIAVYIATDPDIVRGWFVERFIDMTAQAADNPASFYHSFSSLDADTVRSIGEMTWDAINAVNLAEHIEPSRADADLVVMKGADHAVADIIER